MHEPGDIDALVQFWSENSGWGTIPRELWEHRFLNTPLGPASIAMAIDDDTQEIVGQFGFIPSLISVGEREVKAYRPVATIVKESLRQAEGPGVLQMVILQLYNLAIETLREAGVGLIHLVPDNRWLRLFQMVPFFRTAARPLYRLDLPLSRTFPLPEGYHVTRLDYDDERIDLLWQQARRLYRSMVVRDRRTLSWKNSHAAFDLYGVLRGEDLIGLFSVQVRPREQKWQLCDVMSADGEEALRLTLGAATAEAGRFYDTRAADQPRVDHVIALGTPLMQPVLEELGFQRLDYHVHLVVHVLDESLPEAEVAPEAWYLSPNE